MRSIEGMVAWVTGAGTGIGRGGAIALAAAGVTVVLTGRRAAPLEEAAETIRAAGGKGEIEAGDVRDRDAMIAIADRIDRRHGRLDLLFNNHGINLTPRKWRDGAFEGWDAVVDVNVKGVYNCAGAVLAIMRRQGDGLIITTSSMAATYHSAVSGPVYSASKHAVMPLSGLINEEMGNEGIRATVVCPGEVDTPILDQRPVQIPREDRDRLITPADIGDVVVYLLGLDPRISITELRIRPTHRRTRQPGEPGA